VKATVIYDGDCGICEASARWIRQRFPDVSVVSHYEYGLSSIGAVWFINDVGRKEGSVAVASLLRMSASRWWRFVGAFMQLPLIRNIARMAYWCVAKNRARISRWVGLKACGLPSVTDNK
jgi:predicted DCC family thiol-disulfide oxidoreductase YuxK